jgi:DNA-binding GntR family transcriptional regulator
VPGVTGSALDKHLVPRNGPGSVLASAPRAGAAESENSKADVAYEWIRAGILNGTYGAGHRLVLDRLATEIGVSPVPVREALRRLEAEGYVEFQRNVGVTVRTIDAAGYAEAMETLAILEASATALSSPLLRKREITKARRINEAMGRSLDALDPVQFTTLNSEFHETLYRMCPNSYLVGLVDRESARLRGLRQGFAFVPGRSSQAVVEHNRLLDLIEAKAGLSRIEDYARAHRERTVRRFLQRYQAGQPNA